MRKTMDWYYASKKKEEVSGILESMLTGR
jgi:hypothetical protein